MLRVALKVLMWAEKTAVVKAGSLVASMVVMKADLMVVM